MSKEQRSWTIGVCPECGQEARRCEQDQKCSSNFLVTEVIPAEDAEQQVRRTEVFQEKWEEAERLCGVACEERDEAETEVRELRVLLGKALPFVLHPIDDHPDGLRNRILRALDCEPSSLDKGSEQ